MTDTASEAGPAPAAGRSRWWMILLVVSLALNVAVLAAIAARAFVDQGIGRLTGPSYTQLVPRRFLGDIPDERRDELRQVMRSYRGPFREGREALRTAALDLAKILESSPSDDAAIVSGIDRFAIAGSAILDRGAKAAKDMVSKLTPGERKLLGQRIRERAEARRR